MKPTPRLSLHLRPSCLSALSPVLAALMLARGAGAQEIGYLERFALASDREAALAELIPGTDDAYYWRALHLQYQGKTAEFAALMKDWQARLPGDNARRAMLETRQNLLDYSTDPRGTLTWLKNRLGLSFDHQRIAPEARPDLPVKLDPAAISHERFLAQAMANQPGLGAVTDPGLVRLLTEKAELNPQRRRELLQRLRRADFPELVPLLNADLGTKESQGFGEFPVHELLTLAQMEELAKLRPALLGNDRFVSAWMVRLTPAEGQDAVRDPAVRDAWLARQWAFASTLGPVFRPLQANVLHQILTAGLKAGRVDETLFLTYLKLPRPVSYVSPVWRRKQAEWQQPASLDYDGRTTTGAGPIGNDEPLVRTILLQLLADKPDASAFAPWLEESWLNEVLAEAKLTSGAAEPDKWVSLLRPERYQALKDRTDLEFPASSRDEWAPADEVVLELAVKNVPSLLVKVYEINTENVLRSTGRAVNTDLNLDGLTANREFTVDSAAAPVLRKTQSFRFPELNGKRGVWIVEFIGGGKSSRALIRKGGLRHLVRATSGDTQITVLDENSAPVPGAVALLGTQRFAAGKDGAILVPFSTQPGRQDVLLGDGQGFYTLEPVEIAGESYQLKAGFHVAREDLLPGAVATVAIRPSLLINNRPGTLTAAAKVKLTISSVNQEGVPASEVYRIEKLSADAEAVVEFSVPERLRSLTFTLEAEVKNLTTGEPQQLSASSRVTVNGISATPHVSDLRLWQADGRWILEESGRTGEPRTDREVIVTFRHPEFTDPVSVAMKTDASGQIDLGTLPEIASIEARNAAGLVRNFPLPVSAASTAEAIHAVAGEPVILPWPDAAEPLDRTGLSVLETRQGVIVRDVFASAALKNGTVILTGLEPGEYRVGLHHSGKWVTLRVGQGTVVEGTLVSESRELELSRPAPLTVSDPVRGPVTMTGPDGVAKAMEALVFHIGYASESTRVHILVSRYLPEWDAFDSLSEDYQPAPYAGSPAWRPSLYQSARTIGEEYRYVLDRRNAQKLPGNLLPRPGLLLNPWAIADTSTGQQQAAEGEAAGAMAGERPAAPASPAPAQDAAAARKAKAIAPQDLTADYSFLASPGPVAFNLVPDKEGNIVLPVEMLGDRQFVRVLAVDQEAAAVRDFPLAAQKLKVRDLRLADGLDPAGHFSQQDRTTLLEKDTPFAFRDALSAKFDAISDLGSAWRYFASLSNNPELAAFSWLLEWPDLAPEKKRELYSQYACHELSFFLYHKDPAFFREVVRPYLANKRDRTFLDEWLLAQDLGGWLRPWPYGQLNTAERVLLGRRIDAERPAILRGLTDSLALVPQDPAQIALFFETALRGSALANGRAVAFTGGFDAGLGSAADAPDSLRNTEGFHYQSANQAGLRAGLPALKQQDREVAGKDISRFARRGLAESDFVADGVVTESLARLSEDEKQVQLVVRSDKKMASTRDALLREKALEAKLSFFRQVEQTKEWAENNYWHLLIAQQNAALISPNRFWQDYAAWDGKGAFLSAHMGEASGSFAEIMLALGVLDLPFPSQAEKGKMERTDNVLTLTPGGRGILFHQEVRSAEPDKDGPPLLISQNFYREGDRYVQEGAEKSDKFVTGEFLTGVVYGCQVVVTNPSSSRQKLDLLFQIPRGAIAVGGTRVTQSVPLQLEPYRTGTFDFQFYFPGAGEFAHFPVHVSRNALTAASAPASAFHVVDKATTEDTGSWEYVSQNAAPAQVLTFLDQQNLNTVDLDRLAWRLKDADFFHKVAALLQARHVFHPTTWSYAMLHNDRALIADFLAHRADLLGACGPALECPLVEIDPVERRTWQLLEYSPLVNARAHPLGGRRVILNDKFRVQYLSLLEILTFRQTLTDEEELAVASYLALQDRIGEAAEWLQRVEPEKVHERLQADYLKAWLACSTGDLPVARRLAAAHSGYPADKWGAKFAALQSMLDEIDGKQPAGAPETDREGTQDGLAAKDPSWQVKVEAGQTTLTYRNLTEVTVNYYPMDLEFLFSANPFVAEDTSRFRMIQPNRSERIQLAADQSVHVIPLPEAYRRANVLVEITAAGQSKAVASYANSLDVQVSENFGRLQVSHAGDHRVLSGVYVKVFARRNGEAVFYKDGYTDLRGKFDYASVSTDDLDSTSAFSILVLSDEFGAVVKEVAPPQR